LRANSRVKNMIKIDVQDEEHLKLEGVEADEPDDSESKKVGITQSQ